MLVRREHCLPCRCTPSRRTIYAISFVITLVISGGLLGLEPIQAQPGTDIDEKAATGDVHPGLYLR